MSDKGDGIIMVLLEAKSLKKTYDGVVALSDGCLCCEEGKVVGLLGANGSGKSTFSKIISGIVKPCSGELILQGKKVSIRSAQDAKRHGIVMVHQNLSLLPELTVWENINLGHEKRGPWGFLDNREAVETAKKTIQRISPETSVYEKVKNLRPSQKQLVEIAKALSQSPRLLILDEPTASLEQTQVERLFGIIEELKRDKVSIIFISHRLWEVTRICDFIVVFRNGETVGTMDFGVQGRDERQIVGMITGKDTGDCFYTARRRNVMEDAGIEIDNFSVKGKVNSVSFTVKKGEIVGLTGLQGQGQEELLLALAGLLPSEGTVKIDGERILLKHPRNAIRKGMVLVPGDRHKEGLFLQHSVFTNLVYPRFSLKRHDKLLRFKKLTQDCDNIIRTVSITPPDRQKPTRFLSGGNQQKVVVGKWLSHHPKVLLLSDPAKGVDIEAKRELYNIIAGLAENSGASVILYASDNEELMSVCDRIEVMFEGRIVEEIGFEEFSEERLVASSLRAGYSAGGCPEDSREAGMGGRPA